MNSRQTLIDELESSIANTEIRQRAEVLRRITDLFAAGSSVYSGEQIQLFDDVMCRLVDEIEISARAMFGQRIAELGEAPPNVIHALAFDDSIDVAGPILLHSDQLSEAALVENAKTKSQDHLLAISQRATLGEAITDVLVERGNQQVAISTASNPGARFSEFGFSTLVKRCEGDSDLALLIWLRRDIPRQHLLKLFASSSEAVQLKLQAANRRNAELFRELIAQAADQIQTESRERSPAYTAAQATVQSLKNSESLSEDSLYEFARAGKFDETAIALSVMCELPLGLVERALVHDGTEQILVLAKAVGLTWNTTKAILVMRAGSKGMSPHDIQQSQASFNKLRPETAAKAIRFYRLRERAANPVSK